MKSCSIIQTLPHPATDRVRVGVIIASRISHAIRPISDEVADIGSTLSWIAQAALRGTSDELPAGLRRLLDERHSSQPAPSPERALYLSRRIHRFQLRLHGKWSQESAHSLNDLALACSAAGQERTALHHFGQSLAIYEACLGPDHEHVAIVLGNLGTSHADLGEHDKALPLHVRSLSILETVHGETDASVAAAINRVANDYLAMGDLDAALALYRRSLSLRESTLDPSDPLISASLDLVAGALEQLGRHAEALPLRERALAILEQSPLASPIEVASAKLKLASVCSDVGDVARSLELCRQALALAEGFLGPDAPALGVYLNNLGAALLSIEDFDGAGPLLERSLTAYEQDPGRDQSDVLIVLRNLASARKQLGQRAEALTLYERAISLRCGQRQSPDLKWAEDLHAAASLCRELGRLEAAHQHHERCLEVRAAAGDVEDPAPPHLLNELGIVLNAMGESARAIPFFETSLAEYERRCGPDHTNVAIASCNLADSYLRTCRYEDARRLHDRCLAICRATLDPMDPLLATALSRVAEHHVNEGNYGEALGLTRQCVAIRERHADAAPEALAHDLRKLAGTLRAMGNLDEAQSALERSLAILESNGGTSPMELAVTLTNLAGVHASLCRPIAAKTLLERALPVVEAEVGSDHPSVAAILDQLTSVQQEIAGLHTALPYLERSLSIRERTLDEGDHDAPVMLHNMALTLVSLGRPEKGLSLLRRSVELSEARHGQDHPEVAAMLESLAVVQCGQGAADLARSLHERSLAIRERSLGALHPDVAQSLHHLGLLLLDSGNTWTAVTHLERCLKIRERQLGSRHPLVASTLEALARAYDVGGDSAMAAAAIERAMEILATEPVTADLRATVLMTYSGRLASEDKLEAAAAWAADAVSALESLKSRWSETDARVRDQFALTRGVSYLELAILQLRLERPTEASKVLSLFSETLQPRPARNAWRRIRGLIPWNR